MSGWGDDERTLPTAEELFGQAGDPAATLAAARAQLGVPEPPQPRDGPDVSALAEGLGLT